MKPLAILRALVLHALITPAPAASSAIRALYLFKDVLKSNTTALTTSGFNTLIIFGVGILSNGDIMYYSNTPGSKDTLVASAGAYVGGDALAAKVRSFKTANSTTVDRVEISTNAQNIKTLMTTPGPGPTTPLYRNLAALRDAWGLDAVNNDDESIYHADSTAAFGKMLGAIGLRYSIAPYDGGVVSFWSTVRSRVGAAVLDRVYLQCYDGGAGNDPAAWQSRLGTKVVPLLWVVNDSKPRYGTSAAQARDKFVAWSKQAAVAGGGYWNDFDIEKMGLSYKDYGGVLTSVFP